MSSSQRQQAMRLLARPSVGRRACVYIAGVMTVAAMTLGATPDEGVASNRYVQLARFARALELIREFYVDVEQTEYPALIEGSLNGLLQSLDPHSQFMDPVAYVDMQDETTGSFGGVGIVVTIRENVLTIVSPVEDTPGYEAGLLSGDRIAEINGLDAYGMSMDEAVGQLRGEPGTSVSLGIMREGVRDLIRVDIVRSEIDVQSVKDARLLADGVGYVRILQFNEQTATDLKQALYGLSTQGVHGIVLDLRGNPGGLLLSAVEVCRLFLPPGAPIVFTRGQGGVVEEEYRSRGLAPFRTWTMVVLVDGGSASAAEVVAGALRDNHRAVLVGERTFGKGSVQSVLPLDDGSAIRLTTARYYTPSEAVIQDYGIEPNVEVLLEPLQRWRAHEQVETSHVFDPGPDAQLRRALELIQGLLAFEPHAL